jgi:hypothetical protein
MVPVPSAPLRRLVGWLPFLLPPAALALVIWLQPPDHMGACPDRLPWVGRLAYDDWDWSAVVLRGLNASLGRKAGLDREPLELPDDEFVRACDYPDLPLKDRYSLEYPHPATWLFRLPYLVRPLHPPAALCDGSYGQVIHHRWRNESERDIWCTFRWVAQSYAAGMVACLLLLMLVLRRGYEPNGRLSGPVWLLVLPAALYYTMNRFDVLPALLTALSLACLGRRRLLLSAAFLAAATAVKVYPVLLAPIIVRYLWNDRRAAMNWGLAFVMAGVAVLLPSLLATDWQSVVGPIRQQLSRDPLGPTAYGHVLPAALAKNDLLGRGFRLGTVALLGLVLCLERPPDLPSVLRRGAVLVIVFANLSVFYSPQWVLWYTPMLVPLARRSRAVLGLVVALDLVTYLTFPVVMDSSYRNWYGPWPALAAHDAELTAAWSVLYGVLICGRFVILAALVALLVRAEVREPKAGLVVAGGDG